MESRGKLLKTEWLPVSELGPRAVCYTCKYHDWFTTSEAVGFRMQTFDFMVVKTFFCQSHMHTAQLAAAGTTPDFEQAPREPFTAGANYRAFVGEFVEEGK